MNANATADNGKRLVVAATERTIAAPVAKVRALIVDYAEVRPRVLTEHYRDYAVIEGGVGAGTKVSWTLQATSKRVREVVATVTEPDTETVVETDANSSMVTTWTIRPAAADSADSTAPGASDANSSSGAAGTVVRIETRWEGAKGIGGFFERIFAPIGLRRIYAGVLGKLAGLV